MYLDICIHIHIPGAHWTPTAGHQSLWDLPQHMRIHIDVHIHVQMNIYTNTYLQRNRLLHPVPICFSYIANTYICIYIYTHVQKYLYIYTYLRRNRLLQPIPILRNKCLKIVMVQLQNICAYGTRSPLPAKQTFPKSVPHYKIAVRGKIFRLNSHSV